MSMWLSGGYSVCVFVEWCLRCLADGVFPSTRHDGAPFLRDSDSERAKLAGTRMKKRAACIQIRGDWTEFCGRLGFPTWQSSYHPCFCCAVPRASLYDATGACDFSFPHPLNDDVDHHWACERCEEFVRVTQDQHRRLCFFVARRQAPERCSPFELGGAVPRTEPQKLGTVLNFARTSLMSAPSSALHLSILKACRCFSGRPRT